MSDNELCLQEIGKRIMDRRKKLGLTQGALAEKGEVTTQFVSYAESGKRAMRPENLLKISSALEVSADYLLTGEIIDKDLLILSDKLRRLTPSQVRTVEAIIDECNNLFNQKEITLLSQKRNESYQNSNFHSFFQLSHTKISSSLRLIFSLFFLNNLLIDFKPFMNG